MVLEMQVFLQKEGRYSVQHVLHYPTEPMKVKTPALIWEVNLGCLSILFELNGDRTNIDRINLSFYNSFYNSWSIMQSLDLLSCQPRVTVT